MGGAGGVTELAALGLIGLGAWAALRGRGTGMDGAEILHDGDRARAVDVLARTMWGEARGEGRAGMEAVANVVVNRVRFARARGGYWWGNDVAAVCLRPWQFSVWNAGDPNRELVQRVTVADRRFADALAIAELAVDGRLPDRTGGATHYYAHRTIGAPSWARGRTPIAQIGGHTFFSGIG
jgi:N-acetylmuramoyl-L-alanine amidase